jgi:hypothetical protein
MAKAFLTLVLQDSDADTSTVSVFISVDTGDTVTSLTTDYAQVFWDVVRPVVNGVLIRVNITIDPDISGWTNNTPALISDVEEKAILTLRPCDNGRPVKMSIPTIKEDIFYGTGAGRLVDVTNSDYQALKFVLENGVVDGGIGMTDSHSVDICQVLYGEQFFGKR